MVKMERPEYDGVMFWSVNDWSFTVNYNRAVEKISSNQDFSTLSGINEIIELYEIYQIITCKDLKEEYAKPYLMKAKGLMPVIARFFKKLQDDNFETYYFSVCVHYIDEFWTLFEKFSCYESISKEMMKSFLSREDIAIYRIIEHSKISEFYEREIADILRHSDQTARMIVSEYLEEHNSRHKKLYFPKSLAPAEYEGILQRYVDSDHPNAGVLQLIWQSQNTSECPISDLLRLNAKRRSQEVFSKLKGVTRSYGIKISFAPIDNLLEVESNDNSEVLYKYSSKYLDERLDYLSIIENFSTIFSFTDSLGRSRFPSISSRFGVFEGTLGIKGAKEYKTGNYYHIESLRSSAIMQAYYFFLKDKSISVEDVIGWFFTDYLRDEYGVTGYEFSPSSENSGFAEKCKNISSEMEGVLKQHKMYVETGKIDRELFEIASSHIVFDALPSQIHEKYAYANSEKLKQELYLLFSDQCMLSYIAEHKEYLNFAALLTAENIRIDDYKQYEKPSLDFLVERHTIFVDDSGNITPNNKRIILLKDLYDNDVLCLKHCDDFRDVIDELISNGDIVTASRLFSRPESNYLNYILNKAEFSNGLDLRNRYAHGTYSKDENSQARDYFDLLKIMIMVLLKIKEEFELQYNSKDN